jgi:hypothetical protein
VTPPEPNDGPTYHAAWEAHIERNAEKRAAINKRLALWKPMISAASSGAFLNRQIKQIEDFANEGVPP